MLRKRKKLWLNKASQNIPKDNTLTLGLMMKIHTEITKNTFVNLCINKVVFNESVLRIQYNHNSTFNRSQYFAQRKLK